MPAAAVPSAEAAVSDSTTSSVLDVERSPPPARAVPAVIVVLVSATPVVGWTWSPREAELATPAAAAPRAVGVAEDRVVPSWTWSARDGVTAVPAAGVPTEAGVASDRTTFSVRDADRSPPPASAVPAVIDVAVPTALTSAAEGIAWT